VTTREFLAEMERYYGGHYNGKGEGPVIARYLDGKSDRYRDELAQVVVLHFSRKWKMLPSVADFEELVGETRDRMAAASVKLPAPADTDEVADPAMLESVRSKLAELVAKLRITPVTPGVPK